MTYRKKGYDGLTRGINHFRAKLSYDEVKLIRQYYASGGFTYKSLGEKFETNPKTIQSIITGLSRNDA